MADLDAAIRERLADLAATPPSPSFVRAGEEATPEEIAAWQKAWDTGVVEVPEASRVIVLPHTATWEPFPDPRDAAILAVLDDHATTSFGWCRRCSTLREEGWPARQGWRAGDCPTLRAIAEKLGIEVDRG